MALSGLMFAPLLGAYFRADDFLHLFQLANYDLPTNLVIPHGGHVYAVRNFVFYLCWKAFGMEPAGYYAVALITHLINVALLFAIIRRLTESIALATFGAALWGACPVQAGVLEWYSVYGHALAATVLLVILLRITALRRADRAPSRRELWGWFALAVAGTTCFGVGIAVAMILPWVIAALVPGRYRWWRPPLLALVVVVPMLYIALLWAYELVFHVHLPIVDSSERVLVESGWQLPIAIADLASYGAMRLVCGMWCAGEGRDLSATVTAVIATSLVAGLAGVAACDRRTRGPLLACALIAAAVYGIISLGRGFMFLKYPDLLDVATRYHYLALIPVTMALCIGLRSIAARWTVPRGVAAGLVALWFGATLVAAAVAPPWLHLGTVERQQAREFVDMIRVAAADTPPHRPVYLRNRAFPPLAFVGTAFPGRAAAFTLYFDGDSVDGRRFYFVDPNAAARALHARGVPVNRLLIDPRDAPAGVRDH